MCCCADHNDALQASYTTVRSLMLLEAQHAADSAHRAAKQLCTCAIPHSAQALSCGTVTSTDSCRISAASRALRTGLSGGAQLRAYSFELNSGSWKYAQRLRSIRHARTAHVSGYLLLIRYTARNQY
jgi:hypothetical protein